MVMVKSVGLVSERPRFRSLLVLWKLAGWPWVGHTPSAYPTSQDYCEEKIEEQRMVSVTLSPCWGEGWGTNKVSKNKI